MNAAETSLVASFAPAAREPRLARRRARAPRWGASGALGLPTARHEDWRFTSLAALAAVSFARAPRGDPEAAGGAPRPRRGAGGAAARLRERPARPRALLPRRAPAGRRSSRASPTRSGRRPEKVRPHLGRLARPDDHAFVAANAALFEDGGFVLLPRGARIDGPLALVFVTDAAAGPAAVHPRDARRRGGGVAGHRGGDLRRTGRIAHERGHRARPRRRRGRSSTCASSSRLPRRSTSASSTPSRAPRRASPPTRSRSAPGLSRSEIRARLLGERGKIAANGLYMADGARVTDHFSWVEHAVPACTTTESYKGILDGTRARRVRGAHPGAPRRAEDRRVPDAPRACSCPTTRSSTRSRSSRSSPTT